MKFEKEGEWIVGTPIYLRIDVAKAMKCSHDEFVPGAKAVEHGHLIVQETCKECGASRVRYRPATEEDIQAMKEQKGEGA